jgi:hypothetical protein
MSEFVLPCFRCHIEIENKMTKRHMASTFGQKRPNREFSLISKANNYVFLTDKWPPPKQNNVVYVK